MSRQTNRKRRWRWQVVAGAAGLALAAGVTWACGPYFEQRLLTKSEAAVFAAPAGQFPREIDRLTPEPPAGLTAVPADEDEEPYQQTAAVDAAELLEALTAAGMPAEARRDLLTDYHRLRDHLRARHTKLADHREKFEPDERAADALPWADEPDWQDTLDRLPVEFALYLRGAIEHARGDGPAAREQWRRLLELPAEQRAYRSTWAAYMVGRSYVDDAPAEAGAWFEQTRRLARAGFADPLGLAAASLGWEARAALDRDRYEQAIDLYLAQLATGDNSAYASLAICARWVLRADAATQQRVVRHEASRRVVTAYLLAQAHRRWTNEPLAEQWLGVVRGAGLDLAEGAERLAWLAYQAGDFGLAERWLGIADPDEAMTQWLQAKLALRAGEMEPAMERLAAASAAFPAERAHRTANQRMAHGAIAPVAERVRGELGVLHLAREQYIDALDQLLRAGYWTDSAYIAERVLSVEELKAYVDAHWPEPERQADPSYPTQRMSPAQMAREVRHLLARRLTRQGQWREGRPYYPANLRPVLDAYITAIRRGHNRDLDADERAESFWQAARLARHDGLELLGTALGPDWQIYGGQFSFGSAAREAERRPEEGVAAASEDERDRLRASLPDIDKRWHYRYTAADHAWSALALMPDNHDRTAERFIIAGQWLAPHDAEAADRFYKALVNRCGETPLGREADQRRWFPSITEPRDAPSSAAR
ncbi:MAG: hypothetical protein WD534_14385 [Phycisphaeraceae bacterium]